MLTSPSRSRSELHTGRRLTLTRDTETSTLRLIETAHGTHTSYYHLGLWCSYAIAIVHSVSRAFTLTSDMHALSHIAPCGRCLVLAHPTLPFGIRHAHTVTRDAHTGPTRGVPAWAMGLPTMLGQCDTPSPPLGSAAIAPTGCAHALVAALAHANSRARCPSHARPLGVLTSACVVEPRGSGRGPRSRAGL